jgi:hypothetical protein
MMDGSFDCMMDGSCDVMLACLFELQFSSGPAMASIT